MGLLFTLMLSSNLAKLKLATQVRKPIFAIKAYQKHFGIFSHSEHFKLFDSIIIPTNDCMVLCDCGSLPLCSDYYVKCVKYWTNFRYPNNCYKLFKGLDDIGLFSKPLVIYSWVWVCLVSPKCG